VRGSAGTPAVRRTVWRHLGVGALVLVAVASISVLVSVRVGHQQSLSQPTAGAKVVAERVVAPLVTEGVYDGKTRDLAALNDRVLVSKAGSTIERIKVWSEDGVILYSDDPRLIGQRYPLGPDRLRTLTDHGVASAVTDLSRSDNVLDRQFGRSIEVDAGTRDTSGRPILVETYFTVDRLDADEASLVRRIVAVVLGSLLVLGLLFVPLAYSLARRVSRASGAGGARPAEPDTL
jgi:two-component system NarL family sensor kinase